MLFVLCVVCVRARGLSTCLTPDCRSVCLSVAQICCHAHLRAVLHLEQLTSNLAASFVPAPFSDDISRVLQGYCETVKVPMPNLTTHGYNEEGKLTASMDLTVPVADNEEGLVSAECFSAHPH